MAVLKRCMYFRSASQPAARYPGRMNGMDKKTVPPQERAEVRKEAVDAREGDEKLDPYDKEVADSFPASDPPAVP